MNTLLSWLPAASWFLGGLAITSVLGFVAYLLVRWLEEVSPEVLLFVEVVLGCGIFHLIVVAFPYSLVPLVVVGVVCGGGTLAKRATASTDGSWGTDFMRMLFATVCSILLSLVLFLVGSMGPTGGTTGVALSLGSSMGALCSPSVFPLAIWVWRGSQSRPGVERHLDRWKDGETD